MFTIKHQVAPGKQSVVSCVRYDIDKPEKTLMLYHQSGEIREMKIAPGEVVYIENMYGRTCDTVRG